MTSLISIGILTVAIVYLRGLYKYRKEHHMKGRKIRQERQIGRDLHQKLVGKSEHVRDTVLLKVAAGNHSNPKEELQFNGLFLESPEADDYRRLLLDLVAPKLELTPFETREAEKHGESFHAYRGMITMAARQMSTS